MSDREFNKWMQMRLTAHGFPVGPIDGDIGAKTIAALKAFEKAHGLTIDGTADPLVVQALRASSSALPPAVMVQIPNRDAYLPDSQIAAHHSDWPRQSEVTSFFGDPGTNQTLVEVPFDLVLAWDKSVTVRRISLNTKVAASASRVLEVIAQTYSPAERAEIGINIFGGALNVRNMRGGKKLSMHAFGIAIDFDPERNQLSWGRDRARLAEDDAVPFWKAWEDEGWLSLGRARNFDWMHVQAARL